MIRRRSALPPLALLLSLAPVLALSACKGGGKPAEQPNAGGEILPGSVSDAMVPYDQTRSMPPLEPKASGSAGKSSGAAGEGEDAAAADTGPGEPPPAEPAGSGEVKPDAE